VVEKVLLRLSDAAGPIPSCQGDSILLVTPDGHTLLIDAGGLPKRMHSDFDLGEQVVSSYLWNRGIDHLDVVAITHPHADHLGGCPR
jgi:competence protein ComEC